MRGADRQTLVADTQALLNPTQPDGPLLFHHPAFRGRVRLTTFQRLNPDSDEENTAQTIAVMSDLVKRDSRAPSILHATALAMQGATTARDVAAGIHRWIRQHVHFVQDEEFAGSFDPRPDEAEVLVRPVDLLAMPSPEGDCDDFSMLAASMLRAAGIEAAFKTIAADPGSPDYSHVYVVAQLPGGPVALDASHGPELGWEAKATGKSRVWPIKETPMKNLHGLGVDWDAVASIATTGIKSATSILAPRYAVPQLNSGQYIQQGNSIMYQQPNGSSAAIGLPVAGGPSGNTMLYLLLGLGFVLLMVGRRS